MAEDAGFWSGYALPFLLIVGYILAIVVPLLLTVAYFPIMIGACYFSAAIVVEFFEGQLGLDGDYGGWAWVEWLVELILFLGIGVLGEYIGRIYIDVKRRPHYFIRAVHECAAPPIPIASRES